MHRRIAEQLFKNNLAAEVADDGAVFRRRVEHVVGQDNAAGAGHVFDDDTGIAGNMFVNMPADQPRVGVVAAAGGEADDDFYRLATVEIRHRLVIRRGGPSLPGQGRAGDER